jgi:hypothetical protein
LTVNLGLGTVAGNVAERPGDQSCYSGFVGATGDGLGEGML